MKQKIKTVSTKEFLDEYGNPIVPFSASSSASCAVCDAILAI